MSQVTSAASESTDPVPSPYNATLKERVDLNESLALFRVMYDEAAVPDYEPGQYTTLGVIKPEDPNAPANPNSPSAARKRKGPKLIRRAYSIASPSLNKDHIEFYIVRVDEGQLTPKLWQLQAGDPVFMDEKIKGHFTLEHLPEGDDAPNLVMIGTGTGLAPYVAMLKQYQQADVPRWKNLVLIDGCRLSKDLGYREELEGIAAADERIQYIPSVTREPEDSDYDGPRGRVTALLEPDVFKQHTGFELDPANCHVFLCGNPAMIEQVTEMLEARSFVTKDREHPDGNIHFERYW